ncbi:MAG: dihydropyrimidine dehydrogenase, partial [Prevotellaceae bacterium]|nr:dihydropyrimidine dehydrogenase [Prevotellaceae bacterium]
MKTQRDAQWRVDLRAAMKAKERAAIQRVKMTELAPEIRCRNNEEVNCGLTADQAISEAHRCLDCANPTCMNGCPVGIQIPDFIKNIERGDFLDAARILKETSALPAVCGRVCPQEKQCEAQCIHLKMKKEAVAIGYLERFAADYAIRNERREANNEHFPTPHSSLPKIAVVGSGPAGL